MANIENPQASASNVILIRPGQPGSAICAAAQYLTAGQKRYILILDSRFTGKIELHCRDGGISHTIKTEELNMITAEGRVRPSAKIG